MNDYVRLQTVTYHSFESENPVWVSGTKKFLDTYMSFPLHARVLDIGCGEGVALRYLKELGYTNLSGIEMNPQKAARAEQYGTIYRVDAHDMDIQEKFDVILMSHFLEHTHDPKKILKSIKKILTGSLLVVLPFPDTGPDDAHVGKYILGTATGDFHTLNTLFTKEGFILKDKREDGTREPEIWLHYTVS